MELDTSGSGKLLILTPLGPAELASSALCRGLCAGFRMEYNGAPQGRCYPGDMLFQGRW